MGYYMEMRESSFYVPVQHANSVATAMDEYSYYPEQDHVGNIVGLEYAGEKLSEDFDMFQSIAPYVRDGSYIEMMGEDGNLWRWVFRSGICSEVYAKVEWPDQ